jgi:phytoene/squalene synthetase
MAAHAYTEQQLFDGLENDRFLAVMKDVVDRARELFLEGLPLASTVDRRLSVDLTLFSRGGMLVLDKIERQGYRVLHNRPAIGRFERVRLLLATVARAAFSKVA